MGHYAGEMGYYRQDEYDYAAVNAAGFESVRDAATRRVCPVCFGVVLGENALQHLDWHNKPASEVQPPEPVECCASGRCEVCTPGYQP